MKSKLILYGKIQNNQITGYENEALKEWDKEDVQIIIQKKSKANVDEMLSMMKSGNNLGYTSIKRDKLYRL